MDALKTAVLICLLVVTGYAQIFPPKWFPGDVMRTTNHAKIDNALNEVLKSKSIIDIRTVAIGVAALSGRLVIPKTAVKSGRQHSTMPPDIKPGNTGLLLFTKYFVGLKGVWAVVTYDIKDTGLKVALMFSVPFDLVVYNIKFNFKVYKQDVPVTDDLVEQMLHHAGSWLPMGYEQRSEYGVNITGTITNNPDAKFILWINAAEADVSKGPDRHAQCQYKTAALGKRCSRECTPFGWCWINSSCEEDADCHGNMNCYGACKGPGT